MRGFAHVPPCVLQTVLGTPTELRAPTLCWTCWGKSASNPRLESFSIQRILHLQADDVYTVSIPPVASFKRHLMWISCDIPMSMW